MMTSLLCKNQKGFTLLEIIVTLTVASVLGTIIFLYMNTSLTRSTEPVTRIQTTYSLNQIVEQITADYKTLKDSNGDYDLATLQIEYSKWKRCREHPLLR